MRHFKSVLTVLGAVTVLVLAGNTISLAATGHAFILGTKNTASTITTLTKTTNGPALKLGVKRATNPPFSTNGTGKVVNLNADKLDGLDSTQVATNTTVYTDTDSTTVHTTGFWHIVVGPGDYSINWTAGVTPATSGATMLCGFSASPTNFAWASGEETNGYVGVWLSAGATKHFATTTTLHFFCNTSAASFKLENEQPLQINVTKITSSSTHAAPTGFSRVAGPGARTGTPGR